LRYPKFYEMLSRAIKNTWSVRGNRFFKIRFDAICTPHERRGPAPHRTASFAFFATGDFHCRQQSGVEPVQAHQRSRGAHVACRGNCSKKRFTCNFISLSSTTTCRIKTSAPGRSPQSTTFLPSAAKAQFCQRWTDSVLSLHRIESVEDKRRFLLNLTCFASCIEGLFFFGAFAYVYFLRSRGLLPGLAAGTNWVFRDESAHMALRTRCSTRCGQEEPGLFDAQWAAQVKTMIDEAVECEVGVRR